VWQQAQAAAVDIDSPDHDTHDQDIATALSSCLKTDGNNTATGNLRMGGFRHTNVGAAASTTDYAQFNDHVTNKGRYIPAASVGGSADAITLTTGYSLLSYIAGQQFTFIAAGTNTGVAATVNVDGIGAKSLTGPANSNLSAGLIVQNSVVTINYQASGDRFEVATAAPTAIAVGTIMAWPATVIPSGWLECTGQAVSRTTYAALFAGIGTAYGIGDGSTTFNVPDYRGYFLRGQDEGAGNDPDAASRTNRGDGTTGDNVGTKQPDGIKAHNHTATSSVTDGGHNHTTTAAGTRHGSAGNDPGANFFGSEGDTATFNRTPSILSSTNGTGISVATTVNNSVGNETRPKNVNVRWIILALPSAAFAPGGSVVLQAGTTSLAPLQFTSGTNLTSAAAGAEEFDGVQFYATVDTSSGRGAIPVEQYVHLTASGGAISTIANFFGTTSNISLVASAYYVIDIEVFFTVTTGTQTVTWTLTNSAAPTSQNIDFEMSPVTGIVAPPGTATMLRGQIIGDTTAAKTITTAGLSAANHYARFRIWLQNSTGTSLKIQATSSANSITPLTGSMWRCRRISPNNIGTFAA
jgi:microcystin-dependent protein